MEAKDLRIGNYIYNDKVVVQADGRTIFDIWSGEGKYKPIPITDEWLFKFGFVKDDTGVDMRHQDYLEWYEKTFQ